MVTAPTCVNILTRRTNALERMVYVFATHNLLSNDGDVLRYEICSRLNYKSYIPMVIHVVHIDRRMHLDGFP